MSSLAAVRPQSPLARLRTERDRFVAFAFSWADLLFELDETSRIVYATGVLEPLVGRTGQDLHGTTFCDLVTSEERAKARSLLASVRRCKRIEDAALSLIGPGNMPVTLAFSGYRLPEMDGHVFIGLRGRRAPRWHDSSARRDPASGLLKSNAFVESVCRHITQSASGKQQRLSLIRVLGSDLLQQPASTSDRDLARAIGESLRSHSLDGELATRVGPDRFGLLHETRVDVGELKKQIVALVRDSDPLADELAIKCASFEIDSEVLRTEEIAKGIVYIINRFRTSDAASAPSGTSRSFSKLAEQAVKAIEGLKGIISRGDFGVVFQAIVDAQTGDIHHYEALARFPASDSLRGPTEHIALAEEVELVSEFDLAMLGKVVERLAVPTLDSGVKIAVNVSGQSVNCPAYGADLERVLGENGWLRDRLMFEITESSRIDDLPAANQFVLKLRSSGYAVCLDDFGAGAANFQYLASLDVDIIKLDGAAVRCAQRSAKGVAFLKALAGLCRELGIGTVVEMVDSPESLEFARACGANYVQGYLFGKPHADIGLFERIVPRDLFRALQPTE